jgi:hypothetical protein
MSTRQSVRGVSLIDAVVGSALVLLIFLALIGLMRSSLLVASLAKAKAGATAVGDNQMEYIRSLPYDSVGTVGGIPAGVVAQTSTTTQNGIAYGVRTFIEYVDDPADGTGGSDTNAITTDYKRVKVSVTYTVRGVLREVAMVSTYAPASIETTTNGGTLKIIVVNSSGVAVPGATVRVVNASTSPSVDVTTFSDATGIVLLGGAATSTEYQVYVSKGGYSSAQTYARDTTNQNPTPGYLTVVKNVTTASTFAIDLLSTLSLKTYYPISATTTSDTFANDSKIVSQSNVQLSGGSVILSGGGAPGYDTSGTLTSISVSPSYLNSWTTASTTIVTPANTSLVVHVVDGTGVLIPDAVLPGNAAGFTSASINLSSISTTTYPTLALKGDLATTATSTTPSLNDWAINSIVGPTPVPNVSITVTGAKTIGSTGAGASIYKTTLATTTGATAVANMSLEWDSYSLSLSGYDVIDACDPPTYSMSAGSTYANALYLGPLTTNAVLVAVRDNAGAYVSGATVTLSRSGFSSTVTTSSCGTAYFGGLTSSSSYTVQISKAGYTTTTSTNVNISGHLFYATSFP